MSSLCRHGSPAAVQTDADLLEIARSRIPARGRLRLTERGVLLSNEVFQAFV